VPTRLLAIADEVREMPRGGAAFSGPQMLAGGDRTGRRILAVLIDVFSRRTRPDMLDQRAAEPAE
jgi:hypothetical protein